MKWTKASKISGLLIVVGILISLATGQSVMAQCDFDRGAPSFENARKVFKMTNYRCAEEELRVLLNQDSLDYRTRADGHMLLAQIYWAMLRNDSDKKQKVLDEFVKAFKQFQDWRGELDIQSEEFLALMEEAKQKAKEPSPTAQPSQQAAVITGTDCPSSMPAIISSAAFVGSGLLFMVSSSSASDKWDEYEADPLHPGSLYDDYTSAVNMKTISGGLTIAAGAATAYFWWKYMKDKKNCKADQPKYGVYYKPADDMVVLTYSF